MNRLSFYLDGQTNLFNYPSEKRVLKAFQAAGWDPNPRPYPPGFSFPYGRTFVPWGYLQNDYGLKGGVFKRWGISGAPLRSGSHRWGRGI